MTDLQHLDHLKRSLQATRQVAEAMLEEAPLHEALLRAVDICATALAQRRRVFFAGNGGSAAEAQHFAAELLGRFLIDRAPLPAMALHVDTSAMTAIGNDFGFDQVFSRQLQGLGQAGDVLVALSTSGRSKNILAAMDAARQMGVSTIAMTGSDPRDMGRLADVVLAVPSTHTPQIQEGHLVLGHLLCDLVERQLARTA
ncbi:MAG: phosphoheptose isomerase 2 [Pseudomonadota bacterium]